jgi:hypothetical protein
MIYNYVEQMLLEKLAVSNLVKKFLVFCGVCHRVHKARHFCLF